MNFRHRIQKLEKSTVRQMGTLDDLIVSAEMREIASKLPEGDIERLRLERIARFLDPEGLVDIVARRSAIAKEHAKENYAIMQKVEWARIDLPKEVTDGMA